jgi:hypothetical protein
MSEHLLRVRPIEDLAVEGLRRRDQVKRSQGIDVDDPVSGRSDVGG